MSNTVFKKMQLVGTSANSMSDAIANAVAKAQETEKHLSWFEVVEQRGGIVGGKIQYQVTICIGAKLA
jgi:flavin-binding protein dodecin